MAELLTVMATPASAYLLLFGLLILDAFVPVVPTQAIMITSRCADRLRRPEPADGHRGRRGRRVHRRLLAFCWAAPPTSAGQLAQRPAQRPAAALRARSTAPGQAGGQARRAAERFTRGLRKPGPLVILLCRFVPGGRMAACFHAGRSGYPTKLFVLYEGAAALGWASYGTLVGHIGGTAITQSAWRLFAVAACAALIFGAAGWVLALFGGRKDRRRARGAAAATATAIDPEDERPARAEPPSPRPGRTAALGIEATGPSRSPYCGSCCIS